MPEPTEGTTFSVSGRIKSFAWVGGIVAVGAAALAGADQLGVGQSAKGGNKSIERKIDELNRSMEKGLSLIKDQMKDYEIRLRRLECRIQDEEHFWQCLTRQSGNSGQ